MLFATMPSPTTRIGLAWLLAAAASLALFAYLHTPHTRRVPVPAFAAIGMLWTVVLAWSAIAARRTSTAATT
jgi:hypothetical protein